MGKLQVHPGTVEAECLRLVSSWRALRRRNHKLGERAERELYQDVETDLGKALANAPSLGQRKLDEPPSCFRRYIAFADQYGVHEWPVRALTHGLMGKSDLRKFEDALAVAVRSWDEAVETYEGYHARRSRSQSRHPAVISPLMRD